MNPFRPGAGRRPRYMGHRPAIERPLLDIVDRLRAGEADLRLTYLYGPRGNGKTVLLRWLAEQAGQKAGELPITQVRLLPEHLASSEMLIQRIRSAVRQTPGIFDNLTVDLEAGIPGVSFSVLPSALWCGHMGYRQSVRRPRYPFGACHRGDRGDERAAAEVLSGAL